MGVFGSLRAMLQFFSTGEYWTGRVALHMSAEIVSLGGRVSYMFKVPERYRNLLESAIFAQYPKAEIKEVEDYLRNLPRDYDPEASEFEFWGTQLNKRTDSAYPIRTFRGPDEIYEHPAQKTTVDSMSGLIEALSNIHPHELAAVQIVIKPLSDDWKKKTDATLTKLKGLPAKPKPAGLFTKIFVEAPGMLIDGLIAILNLKSEAAKKDEKDKQPAFMTMTDSEKQVIAAIHHAISKLSFDVRLRVLYLAPKDKINKGVRIPEILGAFRAFDDGITNGFRPDIRVTTDTSFKLFQRLEQPYLNYKNALRKNKFLKAFKDRSHYAGAGKTYLNTEELATIFHFPQVPNARVSQIERVHTVKTAPPIDLPVG